MKKERKMSVNSTELKLFAELEKRANSAPKSVAPPTLAEFREMTSLFAEFTGPAADVPSKDITIPARDGYLLKARIYNFHLDDKKPVFVMYPGCGFVLDLFEPNAIAASRIAKYADVKVIIVQFRLCPEVKMPIPIYDAYDALKYISKHPKEFNINPSKIIIGGFSSGAHAATNISSMARFDNELSISHQILLGGAYDLTMSCTDYAEYEKEDKICQRKGPVEFLFIQYGISKEQFSQALFSPLFEKDVSHFPPTTLLIGEYDGVRSDTEAYYQRLKTQNNNVEKFVLPGQTHNHIIMRGAMSDGEDPALTIANIIKRYI
jgi:acetyl esterase